MEQDYRTSLDRGQGQYAQESFGASPETVLGLAISRLEQFNQALLELHRVLFNKANSVFGNQSDSKTEKPSNPKSASAQLPALAQLLAELDQISGNIANLNEQIYRFEQL